MLYPPFPWGVLATSWAGIVAMVHPFRRTLNQLGKGPGLLLIS